MPRLPQRPAHVGLAVAVTLASDPAGRRRTRPPCARTGTVAGRAAATRPITPEALPGPATLRRPPFPDPAIPLTYAHR